MAAERQVHDALEAAGDPASAFLWRRVCRDLDGELRVGVVSREEALTGRVIRGLAGLEHVEAVPVRVEADGDALRPTLGAADRLLSVHVLLWATPATAALGAEERRGLQEVAAAGAPARRMVVLADTELLTQMADDPERELQEVSARVRGLADPSWEVGSVGDLPRWIAALRGERERLARERRREVATLLVGAARTRAEQAVAGATAEVVRIRELLAAEDGDLDAERRKGRRAAAHLLGAMRRHTEQLLVDLHAFLNRVEADLPGQVEAVEALSVARTTLPHWLHHVVESWLADRLSGWRAEVLADLAELKLEPAELARAELLVPSVAAAPIRSERGGGNRLATTAILASGAALVLYGLWVPGVLTLGGGLVWSTLGQRAAQAGSRRALVDAAIQAVRAMGTDAERLLGDQISALEDELAHLGDERAEDLARARQSQRRQLEQDLVHRELRVVEVESMRAELARRIAAMEAEPE
jgi:hypothetical protein